MVAYADPVLWLALVLLALTGGLLGAVVLASREGSADRAGRPSAG